MALERPHTLAGLDTAAVVSPGNIELPQFDGLVKTAADKVAAVRRKSNRVHTVPVAVRGLEALDQVAGRGIPDTNTLVQRSCSHIVAIRRHGNSGHTILNAEGVHQLAIKDIPETNRLITTARCDVSSVASKVERVNVLLVPAENMFDRPGRDVPNLLM